MPSAAVERGRRFDDDVVDDDNDDDDDDKPACWSSLFWWWNLADWTPKGFAINSIDCGLLKDDASGGGGCCWGCCNQTGVVFGLTIMIDCCWFDVWSESGGDGNWGCFGGCDGKMIWLGVIVFLVIEARIWDFPEHDEDEDDDWLVAIGATVAGMLE